MTTLEQCDNESSHSAVLALLALVVKKVSVNILKVKFEEILQNFSKLLVHYVGSDNQVIVKAVRILFLIYLDNVAEKNKIYLQLIVCLASVLRSVDNQSWNLPVAAETFKALLAFVTHSTPKVKIIMNTFCGAKLMLDFRFEK